MIDDTSMRQIARATDFSKPLLCGLVWSARVVRGSTLCRGAPPHHLNAKKASQYHVGTSEWGAIGLKDFVKVNRADLRTAVTPLLASRADSTYLPELETFYSYRPFDRRWFFNDLRLLNRPGPEMQRAWGADNVGLYAIPSGTSEGPAAWCYGLLPDYHAFRGSYGGYAFPLYDRRAGHGPYNLKAELVAALGAAYGGPVTPEAVFDAMLCLLSARSYTTRFAEDLEDVFPHIPFPAVRDIFEDAARVGSEIRQVETFARPPGADFLRGLARAETAPAGALAPVDWVNGEIHLCADRSGRVSNIPKDVWEFSVSGYRVLPRWLAAREGFPIGPTFIPELRDVVARIAELVDLFGEADSILRLTLDDSLSRTALGFDEMEAATDHGGRE